MVVVVVVVGPVSDSVIGSILACSYSEMRNDCSRDSDIEERKHSHP